MIKMLPTGTVFMFQFLNPVLTNNGKCQMANKYMSGALMVVCAFNCCFTSFTDSYVDSDGGVHYGIATFKGFWPKPAGSVDWSGYRVRVGDFFHAFLSLVVFAALSLLDTNTVSCFYPGFESGGRVLLMSLPPVIGLVSSVVFAIFPNDRHGIGYPPASADQDASSKTS
ncbi:Protein DMP2 [Linum grandiflorum]